MTARSAHSASEPLRADQADRPCPIRVPGSARTFEIRDALRGMGLRWDPATHAWHGNLPGVNRAFLERAYGLRTQPVVPIEAFQPPAVAAAPPMPPRPPAGPRRSNMRDSSRTRAEARVVHREAGRGAEEIATPTRRFSVLDITSGLPDDSREAEERIAESRLHDLRGRVKVARKVIASTPGLSEVMASDWRRAARFYARIGVTEGLVRHGVPDGDVQETDVTEWLQSRVDWVAEEKVREVAVLDESALRAQELPRGDGVSADKGQDSDTTPAGLTGLPKGSAALRFRAVNVPDPV